MQGDINLEEIKDQYDIDLNAEVPKEYQVTMPQQYHVYYTAEKATKHVIKVRFSVNVK